MNEDKKIIVNIEKMINQIKKNKRLAKSENVSKEELKQFELKLIAQKKLTLEIFKKITEQLAALESTKGNREEKTSDLLLQATNTLVKAFEDLNSLETTIKTEESKQEEESKSKKEIEESEILNSLIASMYCCNLTNSFHKITKKSFKVDKIKNRGIYETQNGIRIEIDGFDTIGSGMKVSAKKLFDIAVAHLTKLNYYGSEQINTLIVSFSLIEYGKACGYFEQGKQPTQQKIKNFRKAIKSDLDALEKIRISGTETKGKNAGEYDRLRLITRTVIKNSIIYIEFGYSAAKYLANSYISKYHISLLKIDNRNANAYSIGCKIAIHSSIDNNLKNGTQNTISVNSLLSEAPEIPSFDEVMGGTQRNWKRLIKKPLEDSLAILVKIGFLRKWEYRDGTTGKRYTAEEVNALDWLTYSRLCIDFILSEVAENESIKRLQEIEEKQEKKKAATHQNKKKKPSKK